MNQAYCTDRGEHSHHVLTTVLRTRSTVTAGQAKSTMITSQTNPIAIANQGSSRLIALPPELQLRIFDLLDRCSSTCLGLSTRVFYRLHRAARGKVPLCAFYFIPGASDCSGFRLHVLLKEWAGPDLLYHEIKDKFVSRASYELERYQLAMRPMNPCKRWCCRGLGREYTDELQAILGRNNVEKRKDAKEAAMLPCWWV